jgi:hypothetical protein
MCNRVLLSCALVLALLGAWPGARAQGQRTIGIRVAETSGIRRTEYPLHARVVFQAREMTDVAGLRLRLAEAPVAAQYTVVTRWPDGSARDVDVDFNASLDPGETRTYQVDAAGGGAAPPRGIAVTEETDVVRAGSVAYSRRADPLIVSAGYVRREFIGAFPGARNGLSIVDRDGVRHRLADAPRVQLVLAKRGPLVAELIYTADVPVGSARTVPVTLTVEMPNSKSWIRMSAAVIDEARRVRDVVLETPLSVGAFPWLWDFGTENGSYGAFRNGSDRVMFHQIVNPQGSHSWRIDTGTAAEPRPYERSAAREAGDRNRLTGGWGHLVGPDGAVAFGIQGMANAPGTYTITLDGQGQVSYGLAPAAGNATTHRLVVYQHFVSTPVPIGAATTPTSMLHPPQVIVEP